MDNEGETCQNNKDCPSNVCKMIYRNGQPVGRRCLNGSGSKYTKNCRFPKDCQSGVCEKIYDSTGKFVAKKCVKAKKIDRDNSMDKILGKTSSYEKGGEYGVLNDHTIEIEMGEKGPMSKIIIKVISIAFDLFSIIVYNFRKKSYNLKEQGIMYSILATISLNVFYTITGHDWLTGGLISGLNKAILLEEGDGYDEKCKGEGDPRGISRPIDMWYVRTIITIIFPPLGVLMAKGFTGFSYILISCLLTSLFYFPGLIYSLAVVSASRHALIEEEERKLGRNVLKKRGK